MVKPIPTFPRFKLLELGDKKEVEFITHLFEPYSDYNFASLWSYNVKNEVQLSKLNGNLIVRFSDYITGEGVFSLLGDSLNNHTINTINSILDYARKTGLIPQLKLIPEVVVLKNPKLLSLFRVEEDRDNFDHIFSTSEISTLTGSKFGNKRNKVNLFKRNNPKIRIGPLQLTSEPVKNDIMDLFMVWAKNKNLNSESITHEHTAIRNLLAHSDKFNLTSIGLWDKKKLVGFTITENTHHGYSIFHFVKANLAYRGIFEYLYHITAKELYKMGSHFINREQDLGITALRTAKESWRPIRYLKKYTISHR